MQQHASKAPASPAPAPNIDAPAKAKAPPGVGFAEQEAALAPGGGMVGMPDPRALVRDLMSQGITNENEITNELFYRANEVLRGTKLKAGSPEAQQWLDFRNEVVRPEMKASKKAAKPDKDPEKEPEKPASEDVDDGGSPAPAPAPAPKPGGKAKASKDDTYLNQNDNSYDDDDAEWLGGSAGGNTCNMTALSMALVSIAGSVDAAKVGIVAYLKKNGHRSGATAKIGKKRVAISTILKSEELTAQCQLEDLVIAAGVKMTDSYGGVTKAYNILGVAKKSGLVKSGDYSSGKLADPAVRAEAKAALERGGRIVAQTTKHYVYLTEVRDDGIVVHDPAGARTSQGYLWPGSVEKMWAWLGRIDSAKDREQALRRTSLEPRNAALMQRLVETATLKGAAKDAAKEAIKKDFPGSFDLGKANFYNLSDCTEFNCRLGMVMEPNKEEADPMKGGAGG